ncbi:MAG TPA: hypothetical protein VK674_05500 [Candidatus Limnocylindria bacterium]|nr:hypothetical protein [Candidatus Limnocylindria bacterium]
MIKMHKFQELLQRELSRKEFLQVVGLMILSAVGISGMLSNVDKSLNPARTEGLDDYGASSYGG